jgi:starch phosphorylase
LDELDPESVGVELYAEGAEGVGPSRQDMARGRQLVGSVNGYIYTATVPANRPATDYTPRIVPRFAPAAVPLEAGLILWQK